MNGNGRRAADAFHDEGLVIDLGTFDFDAAKAVLSVAVFIEIILPFGFHGGGGQTARRVKAQQFSCQIGLLGVVSGDLQFRCQSDENFFDGAFQSFFRFVQ